jgi:uncharacterized protein YegJ (DUF2314 family)
MSVLLVVLALAGLYLFLRWRRNLVVVDEESGVSQIRGDDADMLRAVAEAKANFGQFVDRLRNPAPQDEGFGVKVAIRHDGGTENLWLNEIRVDDTGVQGLIANDPVHVPFRLGDSWRCGFEDVIDWSYMCDGRMQGNFTLRAMLPRMPRDQQRQFRGMLESRWDTVPLVHRPWPVGAEMPGAPLPSEISHGDRALMDEVPAHLNSHLGTDVDMFHEIISPSAHIDLYPYPPTPTRPFLAIATTGMAEKPMQLPPGQEADAHVELLALLPPDWPMDPKEWNRDERHYWPLRWLKRVARFHYESGHWLGEGHVLDHGDPARIIGDSGRFVSVLLAPPSLLPPGADRVVLHDGRSVRLLQLYFLDQQARVDVDALGWREYLAQRSSALSL